MMVVKEICFSFSKSCILKTSFPEFFILLHYLAKNLFTPYHSFSLTMALLVSLKLCSLIPLPFHVYLSYCRFLHLYNMHVNIDTSGSIGPWKFLLQGSVNGNCFSNNTESLCLLILFEKFYSWYKSNNR